MPKRAVHVETIAQGPSRRESRAILAAMERLDHAHEILEGTFVRLEPLTRAHVDALLEAALEERATYAFTHVPASRDTMARYVDAAIAQREAGLAVPYATVRKRDGRVVGSTRFTAAERWDWPDGSPLARPRSIPDAIEIGWTWLASSAQRTAINTDAKRSMLRLAFDVWQVHRVTLKTDARNLRSRANIERIGGKLDGILRAHMPASDGGVRDSAWYSIVQSEWPDLERRLSAPYRG